VFNIEFSRQAEKHLAGSIQRAQAEFEASFADSLQSLPGKLLAQCSLEVRRLIMISEKMKHSVR
jgi:predicted chitinase